MPRKVCHLLILYGNKNQKYTQNLLENINKHSDDEHFIYCHGKYFTPNKIRLIVSVKQSKFKALLQFIYLFISDRNFRKLSKKLSKRDIYKWLWLIANKIDVLHIHHEHAILNDVIQYFKDQGVKIIISLRGRDLLINSKDVKGYKLLKSKLILADEIHCISHFMKNELLRLYGINAKVIYRGRHLPNKENIKLFLNNNDTIKIIAAGRLVWEKGHIYLIESIYRLLNEGYLFEVDIFGEGNLKEFLQFRINQLGLEKIIHLKGFLEGATLRSSYKNYDIAVQPSLSEALSNGLIDFMFHNLPCVITDTGGMSEIIKDKKNGIVINKKNMLQLDKAILNAKKINFEGLLKYNNEIRDKFTSNKEVEGLLKLYG